MLIIYKSDPLGRFIMVRVPRSFVIATLTVVIAAPIIALSRLSILFQYFDASGTRAGMLLAHKMIKNLANT